MVLSDYFDKGQAVKKIRKVKHKKYLDKILFSDLKAFEIILQKLPKDSMLQLSNSSAVRYAQLFDIDPTISVYSNRGTSGIDGSTSTAIGAAVGSKKQTVLITGDIGFLYDSNARWNNYIPKNFKIILIPVPIPIVSIAEVLLAGSTGLKLISLFLSIESGTVMRTLSAV